jgi:Carboxypeptidase regulatory-like domain
MKNVFRNGAVTGKVMLKNGAPAAGIPVSVRIADSGWEASYSAKASSSGLYRLDGIPEGRYYITAGLSGLPTYFPGVSQSAKATIVSVKAAETAANLDFSLAIPLTGLKISGRLMWPEGQVPPLNYRVVLTGPGDKPSAPFTIPFQQETAVDPDGSFAFFVVRSGGYTLSVSSCILLQPVNIVVTDEDVAGIELRPHKAVNVTAGVNIEGGGMQPRFSLAFAGAYSTTEAISEGVLKTQLPEGEYGVSLSGLPIGYKLKSIVEGSTDLLKDRLKIAAADPPLQLIVSLEASSPPPWVKVSGRVVDRRGPTSLSPRKVVLCSGVTAIHEADVCADGSFEFGMVLPGKYILQPAKPPGPRGKRGDLSEDPFETAPIEVRDSDLKGIELVLPGTKRISTRAIVEGGGPIIPGGFLFSVTDASGRRVIPGWFGPFPDGELWIWLPEGEFRLAVATRSEYAVKSLTCHSKDLLEEPFVVSASSGQRQPVRLTLRLNNAVKLSGRVTGLDSWMERDDIPKVNMFRHGTLEWHSISLNTDGTFEAAARPGIYILSVRTTRPDTTELAPSDAPPTFSTLPFLVADKDVTGIEIDIPRLKQAAGRIIPEDGAPQPAFTGLRLTGDSLSASVRIAAAPDGTFGAKLPEGTYWCSVQGLHDSYSVSSATYGSANLLAEPLSVSRNDNSELQVRVVVGTQAERVKVSGRVVRPGAAAGVEVADSEASCTHRISISGWTTEHSRLGPGGAFEFSQVVPGPCSLQLEVGSYSARIHGLSVPREGITGLTLLAASGRVIVEDGGRLPASFFITAKHESAPTEIYTQRVSLQADGSFTILLAPGNQWISCTASRPFYVVKSMFCGSTDVLNKPVRIEPDDSLLDLRLTLGRPATGRT